MPSLSQRREDMRNLRESVELLRNARTPGDRNAALGAVGIYAVCAQCDGVPVPEIRAAVGSYWPSIVPGVARVS